MKKSIMAKKYLIVVILLFSFLTFLEIGICFEVMWHGFSGYGDIPMKYTTIGLIGSDFLVFFIPVSVITIFICGIAMQAKKIIKRRELFLICICALAGIGIAVGIFVIAPDIPISRMGRQMTAFLIDYFNWMEYPVP
ncbi:MAG: hypothetical protein J6C64_11925 [Lachnospiraceae bacterium]|nr:hypothetical protein [Lachnospiraceae bacterium]